MSFNEGGKKPQLSKDLALPVRYTIPPGVQSQIMLKVIPNCTCYLHLDDDSKSEYIFKLFSDQDGIIRFHAHTTMESEVIARLVIRCEYENKIKQYPLELRSSSKPTNDMPFPPKESPRSSESEGDVLPVISEDQALNLPDKELMKLGYPPRPSPIESPEAFNYWKRIVLRPIKEIKPQVVADEGVKARYPISRLIKKLEWLRITW